MILAGLKLYGRKPSTPPTSAARISASSGCPWVRLMTSSDMPEIAVSPESRPSSPSMKLIAFIIPTYQISVSGIGSQAGR